MVVKYLLFLIIHFATSVACLGMRPQHCLASQSHEMYVGEIFQTFQLIGIIVIMIIVGACCFYFRGAFSGQDRNASSAVVVQSSNERQQERSPPPREERQYLPQVQPSRQKNQILKQFSASQPSAPQKPTQAIKDSNNPYLTVQSTLLKWDPIPKASLSSCAICNIFNKSNSIPIVQVECMEDHCFHIKCISEHRSKQVIEKAGNGLNKCPKCRQTYSPVVKIYCPNCKNMTISVNLVNYSDQRGEINSDSIIEKYGSVCQKCNH